MPLNNSFPTYKVSPWPLTMRRFSDSPPRAISPFPPPPLCRSIVRPSPCWSFVTQQWTLQTFPSATPLLRQPGSGSGGGHLDLFVSFFFPLYIGEWCPWRNASVTTALFCSVSLCSYVLFNWVSKEVGRTATTYNRRGSRQGTTVQNLTWGSMMADFRVIPVL